MRKHFERLLVAALFSGTYLGIAAEIQLATAPALNSASGSGPSFLFRFTPDAHVLFLSAARDLTTDDGLQGVLNLYRYDRATGGIVLVSQNPSGQGGGNGNTSAASASTNGLVAFMSSASNLVAGDTNASEDVFLRDLSSNTTRLVSRAVSGGVPAQIPFTNQALAGNPLISIDGRIVVFDGRARDIASLSDTNDANDVFVYDVQSQSTRVISISTNGASTANGASRLGAISADGRWVAFLSSASDLVQSGPTNRNEEVYLHDTFTSQTTCVSAGLLIPYPGAPAPSATYRCFFPALSADGSATVFKAVAPNATNAAVVHCRTGACAIVTIEADLRSSPRISADGALVAYDASRQIYRNSDLISSNLAAGSFAHTPVMTPDGGKVAFLANVGSLSQVFLRDLAQSSGVPVASVVHDLANLAIDSDGNVAFDSAHDASVPGDSNRATDVFLYQQSSGQTSLVSSRHASLVPQTARGSALISRFSLSGDGRKIVFASLDSDLAAGDNNGFFDVFVRDLESGQVTALSPTNGVFGTNDANLDPAISADGRYVTFAHARLGTASLVRADLQTGAQEFVAPSVNAGSPYNGRTLFSPLSGDGRLVVYVDAGRAFIRDMTAETNRALYPLSVPSDNLPKPLLSPDEIKVLFRIPNYLTLHDLSTGTNVYIPTTTDRYGFSANSRYVIYGSTRYDSVTRSNLAVCTSCANLSISGDGRFVAYESISGATRAIELRDVEANTTTLVSQNAYGTNGNGRSTSPVISHDGAFIVFVSRASDLVPGDDNGTADMFVYDTRTRKLLRITGELSDGPLGAGPASNPVLAADGRTLAFQSFSALMVANDFDQASDIFVVRLGAGDSDNDGLPDDWEVTYFSNLEQGAAGDFDQDGHTNAQEYNGGTDPTNFGSALRVIAVMSTSTGTVQLYWSTIPGKRYRVEYKSNLSDSQWASLPDLYSGGSAIDPNTAFGPAKFYRVVAVD